MTPFECPYTRMVAGASAGALDAAGRARLECHLKQGCPRCQAEQRYLVGLRAQLRAATPALDEVALQRQRRTLLVKAELYRQHRFTSRQQRLGALKAALLAAVVCAALFMLDRTPDITINRLSGTGPIHQYTEGDYAVVELSDGGYELRVMRGLFDRTLLVRLPDGEIEDIGTVFGVTVKAGRTSRVAVSEGTVRLRVLGHRHVTLEAGGVWESRHVAPMPAAADAPVERVGRETDEPRTVPEQRPSQSKEPRGVGAAPAEPSPRHRGAARALQPESRPVATPRVPGRNSMVRGSAQRDATAAEDAMYLRMLELLRVRRTDAARALAKRYLVSFPEGFRRREVARIAGAPSE